MSTQSDKNTLHCSFCGKSQHEVQKLVAGPNVFICDECIELSVEIIGEGNPLVSTISVGLVLTKESLEDAEASGLQSLDLLRAAGVKGAKQAPPLNTLLKAIAAVLKNEMAAIKGPERLKKRIDMLQQELGRRRDGRDAFLAKLHQKVEKFILLMLNEELGRVINEDLGLDALEGDIRSLKRRLDVMEEAARAEKLKSITSSSS